MIDKLKDNLDRASLQEGFAGDLLTLGEGEIGYVRQLSRSDLEQLSIDLDLDRAWGVFSATGEAMALCDSSVSAWSYFADHELAEVKLQ